MRSAAFERFLANLLQYGTWAACALIALQHVTAGIALFISLPVLRVLVMAAVLLYRRDFRLGSIACFVLLVLALACVVGLHTRGS
jgi:uncharacterized membrane protein